MVNAGAGTTLEVTITDQNSTTPTESCEIWEIAFDGMYLNEAKQPRLGRSFIVAGGRVDWIVMCSNPGIYEVCFYMCRIIIR